MGKMTTTQPSNRRKLGLLLTAFTAINTVYLLSVGSRLTSVWTNSPDGESQDEWRPHAIARPTPGQDIPEDVHRHLTQQEPTVSSRNRLALGVNSSTSLAQREHRCAINFYGLPRMFRSLVLPSVIRNVIATNAKYNCDYYVHYYNVTYEKGGRNGKGGKIHPEHVYDIQSHVLEAAKGSARQPIVAFVSHTDDEFWQVQNETIQKIRHTKDVNGNLYYFPWREKNYRFPDTTDNIIKMWHSIQSAWNAMKEHERTLNIQYERVAMLRSDVVYMTPLDIFRKSDGAIDTENQVTVIPAFAKYPVNDRLVYGPADAVKVWAAERFDRMEDHVNRTFYTNPGYGLHSEQFVAQALLTAIQEKGYMIEEHPTLCMFRARPGGIVWYRDCDKSAGGKVAKALGSDVKCALQAVLGRNCSEGTRAVIRC